MILVEVAPHTAYYPYLKRLSYISYHLGYHQQTLHLHDWVRQWLPFSDIHVGNITSQT